MTKKTKKPKASDRQSATKLIIKSRLDSVVERVQKASEAYGEAAARLSQVSKGLTLTPDASKNEVDAPRELSWAVSEAVQRATNAQVDLIYAQQELGDLALYASHERRTTEDAARHDTEPTQQ